MKSIYANNACSLYCTGCGVLRTSATLAVGRGATCKKCHNKRKREERKRRQVKMQLELIEVLGGECQDCKKKATIDNMVCFDFHHVNKEEKEAKVSDLLAQSRPFEIIKEEASKCVLLCACCHRLHHQKYGY